jgi:hypothetical protein
MFLSTPARYQVMCAHVHRISIMILVSFLEPERNVEQLTCSKAFGAVLLQSRGVICSPCRQLVHTTPSLFVR